jgi:hypothetical protein
MKLCDTYVPVWFCISFSVRRNFVVYDRFLGYACEKMAQIAALEMKK